MSLLYIFEIWAKYAKKLIKYAVEKKPVNQFWWNFVHADIMGVKFDFRNTSKIRNRKLKMFFMHISSRNRDGDKEIKYNRINLSHYFKSGLFKSNMLSVFWWWLSKFWTFKCCKHLQHTVVLRISIRRLQGIRRLVVVDKLHKPLFSKIVCGFVQNVNVTGKETDLT